MWARQTLSNTAGSIGSLGDQISFGGRSALGFSLGAVGDPNIWTSLSPEQQAWVGATFAKLNEMIVKTTGTSCPTWAPSVDKASGCFQPWYNSMYAGSPGFVQLRTDGVFDQDTLNALKTTALIHQADFPTAYPEGALVTAKKGLSTGAMVGIAAAGAAAIGGVIYVVSHKGGGKRKTRRKRK